MIKTAVFSFNPFMENTYVVSDHTGECVIIDAGCYNRQEQHNLAAYIEDNNLKPVMALNTHGHIDHILGVPYVTGHYGIPFAVRGEDKFLIDSAPQHGQLYGMIMTEVPAIDTDLSGMEEIKFGETVLRLIHTPGHTPGHICVFDPESRMLFTGDTLFKESIGRTDLPGGDYTWIMRSILDKIVPLGGDVKIFPGHGPHSTIGHEVEYNPFITEVIDGEVGISR